MAKEDNILNEIKLTFTIICVEMKIKKKRKRNTNIRKEDF